ncbi:Amidase signature domain [Trinorchestia longiramus]|nr:Amidase signature domain [Trinorchestia longiramus]
MRCGSLPGGKWLASGGSSGGSAVAVAAGMAYGALGSDTGGSVRNPAALCGLVGLKPSYGLLSRTGLVSLVNGMDCPGVLARSSTDCAALLAALLSGGADPSDSTNYPGELEDMSPLREGSVEGLRVGVPAEYHCAGLQAQVLGAWRRVADLLADGGAQVEQVSLPHTPYAPSCYSVLNTCEVASNYTRYTGVEYGLQVQSDHSMEAQYALTRAAGLSQVVRDRILAGNYFLLRSNCDVYLQQAMKVRRLIKQDFDAVWRDGVDVLLTPTTLFSAPPPELFMVKNYSELTYLQDLCTSPTNLAGLPALSLPVGFSAAPSQNDPNTNEFLSNELQARNGSDDNQCNLSGTDVTGGEQHIEGLPLALQLIGPYGHDKRLLQIAKYLEDALDIPKLVLQELL